MANSGGCRTLFAVAMGVALVSPPYEAVGQSGKDNSLSAAKVGVSVRTAAAYQGYSLIAPMNSTSTFLVDMQGRIVREWKSDYTPALSAYLLENGHLLRPANNGGDKAFRRPGLGGRIQEFDWDGKLVWDYVF